jgi:hypothetical protein
MFRPAGKLFACVLAALASELEAAAPQAGASTAEVVRALDRWITSYRAGAIDLTSPRNLAREDAQTRVPAWVVSTEDVLFLSELRALELLLAEAVRDGSVAAAERVARLAALGLGRETKASSHAVLAVMATDALAEFTSTAVKALLLDLAVRGQAANLKADTALRAAATRTLGRRRDIVFRPMVERLLSDEHAELREAAADALAEFGHAGSVPVLAEALRLEQDAEVVRRIADALVVLLGAQQKQLRAATVRDAVEAAIGALGRGDAEADLAIVRLLERFRASASVPALIGVLERAAAARPGGDRAQSSRLVTETKRVLRSLTGAVGIDGAADWRAFYEAEKDRLAVVASPAEPAAGATSARSFFGIPVVGRRVAFVIDASGSMQAPMRSEETIGVGGGASPAAPLTKTRLDVACEEAWRAASAMEADTFFNVVIFSDAVRLWRKDLARADADRKRALREFLLHVRADGSTNLWGGLKAALELRTRPMASAPEPVDEVFLLSDGAPTAGEVTDPARIVRLVSDVNRYTKVRINTIFIAGDVSVPPPSRFGGTGGALMRALAAENGGTFVQK